jgi:hypothetical protein
VSWALEAGKLLHTWQPGLAEWELAELRIGNQSFVLVSRGERRICLDPVSGESFPGTSADFFSVRTPTGSILDGPESLYSRTARKHIREIQAAFSVIDRHIVSIKLFSSHILTVRNYLDKSVIAELADERSGQMVALASWILNGRPVVVSGSTEGTLALWDLKTRKLTEKLDLGQRIELITPGPRRSLVVVADKELFVLRRSAAASES